MCLVVISELVDCMIRITSTCLALVKWNSIIHMVLNCKMRYSSCTYLTCTHDGCHLQLALVVLLLCQLVHLLVFPHLTFAMPPLGIHNYIYMACTANVACTMVQPFSSFCNLCSLCVSSIN